MQVLKRPVDSLQLDPANARLHSEKNLDAIRSSLRRFGQQKPIVIDNQGIVRAGNGTLTAAIEEGWKEVWVIESDLSATELVAYGIADNRSGELSSWDDDALSQILGALGEDGVDLADLGFDETDLAGLFSEPVDNPQDEWNQMPEFEHEDQTAVQRIAVNFASREDVEAFAKLIDQDLTEKTRSIWFPPAPIGHTAGKAYGTDGEPLDDPGDTEVPEAIEDPETVAEAAERANA